MLPARHDDDGDDGDIHVYHGVFQLIYFLALASMNSSVYTLAR